MLIKLAALLLLPIASLAQTRVPVLVELFTSEGCSSCPPADRLLAEIDRTQPVGTAQILVLSEHVDYWNRLGWRDPFSSAQFSRRQNEYAEAFRKDGAYTPQMVVDGHAEFIGSDGRAAYAAIEQAAARAKAAVALSHDSGGLIVNVSQIPGNADADVYLAVTESGLTSKVTAGENSGRTLAHVGVVRSLSIIGHAKTGQFSKQVGMKNTLAHSRAVVFLQDRRTHEILGSASIDL